MEEKHTLRNEACEIEMYPKTKVLKNLLLVVLFFRFHFELFLKFKVDNFLLDIVLYSGFFVVSYLGIALFCKGYLFFTSIIFQIGWMRVNRDLVHGLLPEFDDEYSETQSQTYKKMDAELSELQKAMGALLVLLINFIWFSEQSGNFFNWVIFALLGLFILWKTYSIHNDALGVLLESSLQRTFKSQKSQRSKEQ